LLGWRDKLWGLSNLLELRCGHLLGQQRRGDLHELRFGHLLLDWISKLRFLPRWLLFGHGLCGLLVLLRGVLHIGRGRHQLHGLLRWLACICFWQFDVP